MYDVFTLNIAARLKVKNILMLTFAVRTSLNSTVATYSRVPVVCDSHNGLYIFPYS